MAQPVIVAAATAESGAALGPGEHHGMRPYSRKAGDVKIARLKLARSASGVRLQRFEMFALYADARILPRFAGNPIKCTKLRHSSQLYETFRSDRLSSVNRLKQQITRSG